MLSTKKQSAAFALRQAFAQHPRTWRDFQYVYPVISRRSKGLSIGVNVNIDKACNFDCVYCSVDRTVPPPRQDVDLKQLRVELDQMLRLAVSGEIWGRQPFQGVTPTYRRINDIAFSGDGEPSVYRHLDKAVGIAAELRKQHGLSDVKLVLVTNATGLDRAATRRALALMDENNGQVWAKLDAGTEAYYQTVDRTRVPLRRVLRNILECGRDRAIVIQSLFLRVHGQSASESEFAAYLERLAQLRADGCRIALVQLYTTARRTAETYATALADAQLDRLAQRLRARLPELTVEAYHGVQ